VHDLLPTIAEIVGFDVPEDHVVDGQSMTKLLRGAADQDRDRTFLMHYPHSPHRSTYFTVYRQGDWKVIYHYFPSPASEGSHYQLYNLADDPFESTNLAEKEPVKLRDMMRRLVAAMEQHEALCPVSKDDPPGPLRPQLPE